MDPKNVFVINDGLDTTIYENHICKSFKECVKVDISTWDKDVLDTFYIHNSSNNPIKIKEFSTKILTEIIKILSRKFGFKEVNSRQLNVIPQGIIHLKLHTLYLSAVALVNGIYMNVLQKCYKIKTFSLQELVLAEIHNDDHILEIYKSAIQTKPEETSHIIYSYFFKYREADTIKFYKLRFIEALQLSYSNDSREQLTNKVLDDVINLFTLLSISQENLGSLVLLDETSVLKNSEHVFKFLRHVCKYSGRKNTADDQCQELITKKCAVIEKPVEKVQSDAYNELKQENVELKNVLKEYKKKYTNLLQYAKKSKENLRKKTSREILDKLSESHNDLIKSQQEKYDQIISITKKNHDDKVKSLTDYYNERMKNLEMQLRTYSDVDIENKNFQTENEALKNTLLLYQDKLENIQNLVLDKPQPTSTSTPNRILTSVKLKVENSTPKDQSARNTTFSKNAHYEKRILDLEAKNEQLVSQLRTKEHMIENYLQQIKYLKDVITDSEKSKKLIEQDNFELHRSIENIHARHNEQFKEYDKLLKKRREEIELHKREIMKLRDHFNSENYTSPAIIQKRRPLNISCLSPITNLKLTHSPSPAVLKTAQQAKVSQPQQENVTTLQLSNKVVKPPLSKVAKPPLNEVADTQSDEVAEPSSSQESVETIPADALSVISASAVEKANTSTEFPDDYDFFGPEDSVAKMRLKSRLEKKKPNTPSSGKSYISVVTVSSGSSNGTERAPPKSQRRGKTNKKTSPSKKEPQSTSTMPSSSTSYHESPSSTPSTGSASTIKTEGYYRVRRERQDQGPDSDSDSAKSTPIPAKRPRGRPRKDRL